ncbi:MULTISPECIES: Rieske (2Fe-2S) protein [unclassified Streptomyces]|uniref:Rieske (2Fe-2S) protein n=1 Tax=unclassified Streptomyces TaxID=2593676 RepID=UPI002DDC4648|nr:MULTISPECIES: Rieske (2Fe-2S) protein [unclassified Streptomyces]WSA95588.1 Rieske (2Fe-2S) protein [Streptomyces sp. NBC_01795]WSB80006.1 Rieske (2Fe-2S) protein [Streptomyces sp. NBC_01775]WSS11787.1 Rieske (2Fe-2S) protein [Streptomyces sp. NBC_01186]WSS40499.1 Rieske (2Fe-2S) protein [Streptomyces sp. NBC_01187]
MTSTDPQATRRTVLCGAALAALGLTTAACGDDSGGGSGGSSSSETPDKPVDLGEAGAVPVGGAKLYHEEKLLVSQPKKGEFKAFSTVCTHKGSILDDIQKGEAVCPLHGSRFHVDTGKVAKGPATKPLPSVPVKESDGKLTAG